jgi:hypothetical protein
MTAKRRQGRRRERLRIRVLPGRNFLAEQCDGVHVGFDLALDVRLVIGVAAQHIELGLFRHLPDARRGRQGDALRSGQRLELIARRRMIFHHHGAKVLDRLAVALLLSLIAGLDLENTRLGGFFVERGIRIVRAERQRRERQRRDHRN